ncbi:MAG: hypothetical protein LQ343_002665 [Gyalolechia ehrenbergii]|nr:MAG: hypothetical protein LQ343_002665 [Gyalolechia ehrenbergii]
MGVRAAYLHFLIITENGSSSIAILAEAPSPSSNPTPSSFHSVNAWDEGSSTQKGKTDVILDLSTYENLDILKRFWYENMKSTSPFTLAYTGEHAGRARCSLRRFQLAGIGTSTVSTSSKPWEAELIFVAPKADSVELPTFNSNYACNSSRYIYGISDCGNSTFSDGLTKLDTLTRSAKTRIRHAQSPGEPIFADDPDRKEDDGGAVGCRVAWEEWEELFAFFGCEDFRGGGEGRVGVCGRVWLSWVLCEEVRCELG